MNGSPEQSQQQTWFFLCLLCLLQQIKHEWCDFSNFKCCTIKKTTQTCVFLYVYETLIVCICFICVCVCVGEGMPHVSLILKCRAHSVWLNNEFSRLRTGEPTMLITQINKHADEQQQWNNGNTIGSVSSVADREDNYSYPPTPSLPFKHPHTSLLHAFLSLLFSPSVIFFLSFSLQWFLSLPVFLSLSVFFFNVACLLLYLTCN